MVAPSYQKFECTEPYEKNGKMYCMIIKPTGVRKEVRWYSNKEYSRLYKVEIIEEGPDGSYERFGFHNGNGAILVIGGTVSNPECYDWLCQSKARYATMFGWYFYENLMGSIPPGLSLHTLEYNKIATNFRLHSKEEIEKVVKSIGGRPNVI